MSADPLLRHESCREFVAELTGEPSQVVGWSGGSVVGDAACVSREGAKRQAQPSGEPAAPDLWHLSYPDASGQPRRTTARASQVRQWLKEGLLGKPDQLQASRTPEGPYVPLAGYPEFQEALRAQKAAGPLPEGGGAGPWLRKVAFFLLVVGTTLVAGHFLFRW
jgi:hypothetical protein